MLLFSDFDPLGQLVDDVLQVFISKTLDKIILKLEDNYAEVHLLSLIFALATYELPHPSQFSGNPPHEL
jgi:hypothetical protein